MTTRASHVDAVVIGANMRGLLTAYLLDKLGYRSVLVDKGTRFGGADSSFVTPGGATFDHGMHVLDDQRSPLATNLLRRVTGGAVHRTRLRRGIVLRGHLMPYAPAPADMPDELRRMLPGDELSDELCDEPPTRHRLAGVYGADFADVIFDEVLPSFPSESRHLAFGVDESRLLANIYPWFFPRARRAVHAGAGESRRFHDKLRAGVPQHVLYPRDGGFGGFATALAAQLDAARTRVALGARDLRIDVRPGTHTIDRIDLGGESVSATHYFWAAAWPGLCALVDLPCQDVATDRVVLGSFVLNKPARTDYHEILVGDPAFHVNRLYFPAAFRQSDEPLLQIEYAFPRHGAPERDDAWWRERWLDDLRRLGIIDDTHEVREVDVRSFPLHFNSFGMEGVPLEDADPALLRADTNIRPVVPSMANLNLNNYVPRTVAYVTSVLAGTP